MRRFGNAALLRGTQTGASLALPPLSADEKFIFELLNFYYELLKPRIVLLSTRLHPHVSRVPVSVSAPVATPLVFIEPLNSGTS